MARESAKVTLERPLRIRTVLRFSAEACRFPAVDVALAVGASTADGKSPLSTLALAVTAGARVEVVVTGPEAERVLRHLCAILEGEAGT